MTATDKGGRVPLHYAALDGEIDKVRRLLGDSNDPDPRDLEGWTPLLFASRAAHTGIIALLLDAGARVDAVTDKGYPALYWAIVGAGKDPVGTIRLLRARGADPEAKTMKGTFGLKSPLDHLRKFRGKPEICAEFADLL
ncbi:ankyrin repeat domain-containing protein [Rhodococcoides yunnanense]|uniref:ankyrin repeat domain-containing protein n=1 Tax=Rhodococcoides yunnanense TaxID=278209 RepID=UPI0009324C6B|nr:ankyrin repeat domain-containing protein [Rhodococcus yunnanensis]